ncbi:Capsular polysaccharide biosynthesis protein [Clostridium amylolyticum]|uniref:Capsular polysaccharide biosynthesis protein n=1 Tax=Clostridium amylolyticum TaxID=1121298 RepID=A0A1M6M6J5_9CLOT|nr:Wzz/FepE/Etk N-terminal domain-containing protein [Clostridium amylolyticum]SHJ79044.1 Capsular polysaccharide biosynthesis protein [Clostridium amylolyticum]
MEDITLKEIIKILVKRKALIRNTVIIFAVMGLAFSLLIKKPTYSATATIMMQSAQNQNTYSTAIKSDAILNEVVKSLPFSISVAEIKDSLTVTSKQGTQTMEIVVKNKDREKAMKIANQVSETFVEKISDVMKAKQNVSILSPAVMPNSVFVKNVISKTIIFAILGLMFSIMFIFLLEYLDNSFKTQAQLEQVLELPVLGVIPFYEYLTQKGVIINEENKL